MRQALFGGPRPFPMNTLCEGSGRVRIWRRRPRSACSKSDIVETVAHLSIVIMESYALKELSEAEMLRVEKHVARCPKCRVHLEEELGWASAMRSPFMARVRKMIAAERKKRAKG